jgi:hypothetical protein
VPEGDYSGDLPDVGSAAMAIARDGRAHRVVTRCSRGAAAIVNGRYWHRPDRAACSEVMDDAV